MQWLGWAEMGRKVMMTGRDRPMDMDVVMRWVGGLGTENWNWNKWITL
jgi:hypothetical protein